MKVPNAPALKDIGTGFNRAFFGESQGREDDSRTVFMKCPRHDARLCGEYPGLRVILPIA
eukprot:scaffold106_cov123-Cylindrotheca_fusiformis.AAC.7